jgi:hypothetical protein
MVRRGVWEQYRRMKSMANPTETASSMGAGKAKGILAAKKSNPFLSPKIGDIANPVQQKDILQAQFGI